MGPGDEFFTTVKIGPPNSWKDAEVEPSSLRTFDYSKYRFKAHNIHLRNMPKFRKNAKKSCQSFRIRITLIALQVAHFFSEHNFFQGSVHLKSKIL